MDVSLTEATLMSIIAAAGTWLVRSFGAGKWFGTREAKEDYAQRELGMVSTRLDRLDEMIERVIKLESSLGHLASRLDRYDWHKVANMVQSHERQILDMVHAITGLQDVASKNQESITRLDERMKRIPSISYGHGNDPR